MKTIIAVFQNKKEAEKVINKLRDDGVPDKNISCVYKDETGHTVDAQSGKKAESGIATGATTGGVVGAIAGLAVANGILPGLGTLFVAGPLAAALGFTAGAATTVAGAVTGVVAGGLLGGLSHLGVKKEDTELYENLVKKGSVLAIVRSDTINVMSTFLHSSAQEVREYDNEE